MRFSPRERAFTLRFRDDPVRTPPDPTEIYLPARRLYDDGFEVEIEPAGEWRFDAHQQRLLVYRGPAASHVVRVRPR